VFAATGYATSLDGLVWCHREDVVFDDELRQQGGANVSYDPVSRQYRMFYEAASDSRWQIFRVTADWTLPRASFTTKIEVATGLFVFDATGSRAPAAPVVRYDWSFGDGTRALDAGPRPEHRYERTGAYDVELTVTDGDLWRGCVGVRVSVSIAPTFRRGDCNDDGTVDISDAVSTLGSLFLGDGDPGCDDACDSNDDGIVDTSDPITTLGALFLGAPQIPAPGIAACGVDPTEDVFTCDTAGSCTE
jgi:hypothetical protein